MAKKLLLMEFAVAITILILEGLIEEADDLAQGTDKVFPGADKLSPAAAIAAIVINKPVPFALAILCLWFSVGNIFLWLARFFKEGIRFGLYEHAMNVLHFLCSGATVACSCLEVLKLCGLHLKNFKDAPLILAAGVFLIVTAELVYEFQFAPKAGNRDAGDVELTANAVATRRPHAGSEVLKLFIRY